MSLIRRRLLDDTIKKTASGNPIAVQSVARMRPGIKIFGRSTQDGTPSPDHPVPIENIGENGQIDVTISEKGINLLKNTGENKDYATSEKNWRYVSQNNAIMTINGNQAHFTVSETGANNNTGFESTKISGINFHRGEKYVWSCDAKGYTPSAKVKVFYTDVDGSLWKSTGEKTVQLTDEWERYSCEFTVPDDFDEEANRIALNFAIGTDTTAYLDIKKLKLERGSIATGWSPSPYDGETLNMQTLTLSTPGGLPGIPVNSGGNYTDENGQQWVCDEIDLARGVYVQRVGHNADVNDWGRTPGNPAIEPTTYRFSLLLENIDNYKFSPCICNRLPYAKADSYGTEGTYVTIDEPAAKKIFARIEGITSLEDFKAAVPDLEVIWLLETPIEKPLSAEQIAAYKALQTYNPTTTMMNNEKAGMKLTYKTRKGLETDA